MCAVPTRTGDHFLHLLAVRFGVDGRSSSPTTTSFSFFDRLRLTPDVGGSFESATWHRSTGTFALSSESNQSYEAMSNSLDDFVAATYLLRVRGPIPRPLDLDKLAPLLSCHLPNDQIRYATTPPGVVLAEKQANMPQGMPSHAL